MIRLSIISVTLLLGACGSDDPTFGERMVGSWDNNAGCEQDEENTDEYKKESLHFTTSTHGHFNTELYFNGDSTCTEKQIALEIHADFEIGDDSEVGEDIKDIDLTILRVDAVPHDQDFVDQLNEVEFFGYDDWVLGEAKNITGREGPDGDVLFSNGEIVYGLVKLSDDDASLMFAADDPGDPRPTSFADADHFSASGDGGGHNHD